MFTVTYTGAVDVEDDVVEDDVDVPAVAPTGECSSIAELAGTVPELSTLALAVSKAPSVAEDLSSLTEEFTVFAPSDEAFAMVPQEPLMALLEETPALTFILELHIVPGTFLAADLMDGDILETVNGSNLTVYVDDVNGTVSIAAPDGGTIGVVSTADVAACNGVVHVIDSLLIPGAGVDGAGGASGPTGGLPIGGYGDAEPTTPMEPVREPTVPEQSVPEPTVPEPEVGVHRKL